MFLLLKEESHYSIIFEKLLESKSKNRMCICLKTLKIDNIPLIRYRMICYKSHDVANVIQHVRLY